MARFDTPWTAKWRTSCAPARGAGQRAHERRCLSRSGREVTEAQFEANGLRAVNHEAVAVHSRIRPGSRWARGRHDGHVVSPKPYHPGERERVRSRAIEDRETTGGGRTGAIVERESDRRSTFEARPVPIGDPGADAAVVEPELGDEALVVSEIAKLGVPDPGPDRRRVSARCALNRILCQDRRDLGGDRLRRRRIRRELDLFARGARRASKRGQRALLLAEGEMRPGAEEEHVGEIMDGAGVLRRRDEGVDQRDRLSGPSLLEPDTRERKPIALHDAQDCRLGRGEVRRLEHPRRLVEPARPREGAGLGVVREVHDASDSRAFGDAARLPDVGQADAHQPAAVAVDPQVQQSRGEGPGQPPGEQIDGRLVELGGALQRTDLRRDGRLLHEYLGAPAGRVGRQLHRGALEEDVCLVEPADVGEHAREIGAGEHHGLDASVPRTQQLDPLRERARPLEVRPLHCIVEREAREIDGDQRRRHGREPIERPAVRPACEHAIELLGIPLAEGTPLGPSFGRKRAQVGQLGVQEALARLRKLVQENDRVGLAQQRLQLRLAAELPDSSLQGREALLGRGRHRQGPAQVDEALPGLVRPGALRLHLEEILPGRRCTPVEAQTLHQEGTVEQRRRQPGRTLDRANGDVERLDWPLLREQHQRPFVERHRVVVPLEVIEGPRQIAGVRAPEVELRQRQIECPLRRGPPLEERALHREVIPQLLVRIERPPRELESAPALAPPRRARATLERGDRILRPVEHPREHEGRTGRHDRSGPEQVRPPVRHADILPAGCGGALRHRRCTRAPTSSGSVHPRTKRASRDHGMRSSAEVCGCAASSCAARGRRR